MSARIPTGFLKRAAATGRIALQFGRAGAGRVLGDAKVADARLGEAMLSELDSLKGMAMKVGQIMSYMDVGLSEEDGSIVALDFGCVREFEPAFIETYRSALLAILSGDHETLSGPEVHLTRDYWLEGRQFTSPSPRNARHQGFPPECLWLQRTQWGLWAVLTRLGASGDFGTPIRQWLEA